MPPKVRDPGYFLLKPQSVRLELREFSSVSALVILGKWGSVTVRKVKGHRYVGRGRIGMCGKFGKKKNLRGETCGM